MRGDSVGPWQPLLEFETLARPFYKALALVRALSPRWKLSAAAQFRASGPGGSVISLVGLEWALGEVVAMRRLGGPVSRYCTLRQWGHDEPFYGDVRPDSPVRTGAIRLEGEPFPSVRAAELLAAAEAEIARRDAEPPPV